MITFRFLPRADDKFRVFLRRESVRVRRKYVAITVVLVTSVSLQVSASTEQRSDAAMQCEHLEQSDFSALPEAPTQITGVSRVEGGAAFPSHCLAEGYVSPQVRFELRLPEVRWNGKLIQVGSGGHGGILWADSCNSPLQRGYACVVTDMGHQGTVLDGNWARDNLQGKLDWGYRSTHVVTIAAKALIRSYYGRDASHSYFSGCSTGGRQALQEAQRFPWDYDGIIAGAPPIRLADLYVTFAWSALANRDGAGKALLTQHDLELLTAAALSRCDMDDRLQDGIISRPMACQFRPSELTCSARRRVDCLTPAKVAVAQKIYSGPTDSASKPLYGGGAPLGSESTWVGYYLDDQRGRRPYIFELANNGIRSLFSHPERRPDWTIEEFRFDQDYRQMDQMQALYDSSNPDLTRFMDVGGKLIIYIGMSDISMPHTVVDYYRKVVRVMGGERPTSAFARLFLLPGVGHCGGGAGADVVDHLTYLENWVERGMAPERLVAYRLKTSRASQFTTFPPPAQEVEFSRPVYPYPVSARYRGRGNPNDASSFEPVIVENSDRE